MCWRTRGEGGGRCWTELLSSNSLTTERAVYPTPSGVCNELAIGAVIEEKHRLFLFTSSSLRVPALRAWQQYRTLWQELVKPSIYFPSCSLFPSHSHTRCLFVSPTPSFFIPLYIHPFVLGKLTPTLVEGEGGWLKAPKGKTFQLWKQT